MGRSPIAPCVTVPGRQIQSMAIRAAAGPPAGFGSAARRASPMDAWYPLPSSSARRPATRGPPSIVTARGGAEVRNAIDSCTVVHTRTDVQLQKRWAGGSVHFRSTAGAWTGPGAHEPRSWPWRACESDVTGASSTVSSGVSSVCVCSIAVG